MLLSIPHILSVQLLLLGDGDNSNKDQTTGKNVQKGNQVGQDASGVSGTLHGPLEDEDDQKMDAEKDGNHGHELANWEKVKADAEKTRWHLEAQVH